MTAEHDFTKGKILPLLLKFMIPVFFALLVQSLYGAVDLFIVGHFADSTDISAVSTGSQIMMTITNIICSFATGTTIILGRITGQGKGGEGGRVIGASICIFGVIAVAATVLTPIFSPQISAIMNAPADAFDKTVSYIRVCGLGSVFIIAYNLIGSIFRGIGDSKTPLITVIIACVFNIIGDLLFVAVFKTGASGAAAATVAAQALSVLISLFLIKRKGLPFEFRLKDIKFDREVTAKTVRLGAPIALQDFLVGVSFLVILAIVNAIDLSSSAAIGVAEKVCAFIMLVPLSFMQAMAAFVAQNIGAGRYDRAKKSLLYAVSVSTALAVLMFAVTFFKGDLLSAIFADDPAVIAASADYLKAYAIDCLLTCFLFCFIGFFNGLGKTGFVMIQGIIGAFAVRVPVSFIMSRVMPVSLFRIALATPCSTLLQIIMCLIYFVFVNKKYKRENALI